MDNVHGYKTYSIHLLGINDACLHTRAHTYTVTYILTHAHTHKYMHRPTGVHTGMHTDDRNASVYIADTDWGDLRDPPLLPIPFVGAEAAATISL